MRLPLQPQHLALPDSKRRSPGQVGWVFRMFLALAAVMSNACLEVPEKPIAEAAENPGGADASAIVDGGRNNDEDAGAGVNATGRIELAATTWLSTATITVRFTGISRGGNPFIAVYSERAAGPVSSFPIPFVEGALVTSGTHPFDPLPVGSYVVRLVYDTDRVLQEVPFNVRADSDGDRTADDEDGCPLDPGKITQGICGCGAADRDANGDGEADCIDECAQDPGKIGPGVCGCGVADDDRDGDGTLDCKDECPDDATKNAPGVCGCALADTDGDGDGTLDCRDQCPVDASKVAPGVCGCGVAEGSCLPAECSNELLPNIALVVGDKRCSQNGLFNFGLGTDGYLTLRQGSEIVWSAFQSGPAASMKLQGDGNLVARSASNASVWSSGTAGKTGAILTVEENGSVVLRLSGVVVWSIGPFQSGDTSCREARENQVLRLACPVGQTISTIEFASYGKPTGTCGSLAIDSTCHYSAQDFVEMECVGDNTCEFLVDKAQFTIPCAGSKRLVVAYACSVDECPEDPAKLVAGLCGCGVAEDDADGDGTPDCVDQCADDALKIAPGACGCALADTDGDGDGTPDCVDECPNDALKVAPGACGCSLADTDADSDGTADCQDQCSLDPNKVAPGVCGCGIDDGNCPPACSNELLPNGALLVGEKRCSPNGLFSFALGTDGYLTLRQGSEVVWSAFQSGPAASVKLQGDGNLVARSAANVSVWSSGSAGKTGAILTVEDNGSVVWRLSGVVVWSIGPFQSGDTSCREARENQAIRLSCPLGQTISAVEFASYGKPTGVCGSYAIDSTCHYSAQSFVETECVGDNTCEFLVDKAKFTIPCTGSKRLAVAYSCSGE